MRNKFYIGIKKADAGSNTTVPAVVGAIFVLIVVIVVAVAVACITIRRKRRWDYQVSCLCLCDGFFICLLMSR